MPLCERSSAKLCVALSSLLAGTFSASTVGQELLPLRPEAAVYIHVSARDELPGTAFTALRTEATRIWARHASCWHGDETVRAGGILRTIA
jgi:hypothetical protein